MIRWDKTDQCELMWVRLIFCINSSAGPAIGRVIAWNISIMRWEKNCFWNIPISVEIETNLQLATIWNKTESNNPRPHLREFLFVKHEEIRITRNPLSEIIISHLALGKPFRVNGGKRQVLYRTASQTIFQWNYNNELQNH